MRPLLAMLLATALSLTAHAATGAASEGASSEAAVDIPTLSFAVSHPIPTLITTVAVQPSIITTAPQTFLYTPLTPPNQGWFGSLSQRFGGITSPFVLNPGTASNNNPSFGQISALPLTGNGMLRSFPQIPEGSFSQMTGFARALRSEMSLSAGLRALDRAHGMVAALALRTRFGEFSIERGESQGRFGSMSMQPVTVVRFQLPRL